MKKLFFLMTCFIAIHFYGFAQNISTLKRAINAAEEIESLTSLITIATDIIETSSYTLDQLDQCQENLKQLDGILESEYAASYMSAPGRKAWMRKTRWMAGNVKMYSDLLMSIRKILVNLKEELAKQKSTDGEIGLAVKELISNVMKGVKKIPVYGQIIDGAASIFGAGSGDAAFIPITNAVKGLGSEDRKSTAEEQLIAFLIKINNINESISALVRETELAKSSISSTIGYNIMVAMPNRSVREYKTRHRLNIK